MDGQIPPSPVPLCSNRITSCHRRKPFDVRVTTCWPPTPNALLLVRLLSIARLKLSRLCVCCNQERIQNPAAIARESGSASVSGTIVGCVLLRSYSTPLYLPLDLPGPSTLQRGLFCICGGFIRIILGWLSFGSPTVIWPRGEWVLFYYASFGG